ncbi:MAG: FHA domain-containing protein [Kofleriaceae bacterium]|nr:FHA domain-containing protein [Kofleriaceae bacterium]
MRVFLEYMGDSLELPVGETLIGRDISCAMRFNDPSVSRKHLRFIRRQGEVFVEDLGSANGTLLNGDPVGGAARRIFDGDKVSVGTRLLTVRLLEENDLELPQTFVLAKLDMTPTKNRARGSSQIAATVPPPMGAESLPPTLPPLARRRHDRLPIELRLVYASTELEVEAVSRDLSESGVFVCSTVLEPIGTTCNITLLVDGAPAVEVRGVVRRIVERPERLGSPIGFAVEFVGVAPDQLTCLRMIVARTTDQTRPIDLT